MNILIVHKDKECAEVEKIKKDFSDHNIKSKWKNFLSKSDLKEIELVISIGGDGTFLSASHFVENMLMLGVNSNHEKSEGALTTIKLEELNKKLSEILNKNYKIKEYTREIICILKNDRCIRTEHALNEIFFGNINPHHPSAYLLNYKNKEESQKSSGVLVSTGTGSTAWYKSMGGWPFSRTKKQLRFRIREPFRGRIHKPEVIKGKINPEEKLIITSKTHHGLIAIDSIRTYEVNLDDKIEISIGPSLKVIQ